MGFAWTAALRTRVLSLSSTAPLRNLAVREFKTGSKDKTKNLPKKLSGGAAVVYNRFGGDPVRFEKLLVDRGLVTTRGEAKKSILGGEARILNEANPVAGSGRVCRTPSLRVSSDTCVEVNGQVSLSPPLLAVLNKPLSMHSVLRDPQGRPTLQDAIDSNIDVLRHLHPVGRLDSDTSGALLFSREGYFTQWILAPENNVLREYEALVRGTVDFQTLFDKLNEGVQTSDGVFQATLHQSFAWDGTSSTAENLRKLALDSFRSVQSEIPESDPLRDDEAVSYVRLSVSEGKFRMVRRLLHNSGHSVLCLHRRSFGPVTLNPVVPMGEEPVWPPVCNINIGEAREITLDELSGFGPLILAPKKKQSST